MFVLAMRFDLHLPSCRSLKEKRSVLCPMVDGLRHRFPVSVAETGHQRHWQRAEIGVVVVASSERQATEMIDDAERFVWSRPDVEVSDSERSWLET